MIRLSRANQVQLAGALVGAALVAVLADAPLFAAPQSVWIYKPGGTQELTSSTITLARKTDATQGVFLTSPADYYVGSVGLNDSATPSGATIVGANDDSTSFTFTTVQGFIDAVGAVIPSGIPVGANPTATVNGTATNGVATTFMRSDGAPALADPFTPADGTQNVTGNMVLTGNIEAYGDLSVIGDTFTDEVFINSVISSDVGVVSIGDDVTLGANGTQTVNVRGAMSNSGGPVALNDTLQMADQSTPATAAANSSIYSKSGNVFALNGAGVEYQLTPIGTTGGANPTATVNGTATNGAATTFLRSDGAPALANPLTPSGGSQAITGGLAVDTNVLLADAANNRVGINVTSPARVLDMETAGPSDNVFLRNTSATTSSNSAYFLNLQSTSAPTYFNTVLQAFAYTQTGSVDGVPLATSGRLYTDAFLFIQTLSSAGIIMAPAGDIIARFTSSAISFGDTSADTFTVASTSSFTSPVTLGDATADTIDAKGTMSSSLGNVLILDSMNIGASGDEINVVAGSQTTTRATVGGYLFSSSTPADAGTGTVTFTATVTGNTLDTAGDAIQGRFTVSAITGGNNGTVTVSFGGVTIFTQTWNAGTSETEFQYIMMRTDSTHVLCTVTSRSTSTVAVTPVVFTNANVTLANNLDFVVTLTGSAGVTDFIRQTVTGELIQK